MKELANRRALLGVVLCGGKSSRMGTDKGLLKENDLLWAQIAASKLAKLDMPVIFSVNQNQKEYETSLPEQQFVADRDDLAVRGPLLGLLSVHLKFSTSDLFVLACDMKDITPGLLENLFQQYEQNTHEAFVYSTADQTQPLCGIYTATGLKKIKDLVLKNRLHRQSMMAVLQLLKTNVLPVAEESYPAFKNYNSPEDI